MQTIRRLCLYLRRHGSLAAAMIVGLLGFMGLEMVPPLLLRRAIDDAIPNQSMSLVLLLAGGYVLVALSRGVFSYIQWYCSELLGQRVTRDIQLELHDHLQSMHGEYFRRQKTGDLMSRVTGDVESVQHLIGWGTMLFAQNTLTLLLACAILFLLDWQLTLVTLIVFPLLFVIVMRYDKVIRPIWKNVREEMAKLTTVLQENVSGVRTVKAFAREDYEVRKFTYKNQSFFDINMQRVNLESNTMPLIDFISGLSIIVLLSFGGWQVINGRLTLGTLIAFQGFVWKLIWPTRMMGWLINMMEQALAAAPRLFEIVDTEPAIRDEADAVPAPRLQGRISFEQVSFRFGDGEHDVLSDISFTIEPGQVVAVIGGTGSGKSTLVSLIPRIFEPTSGRICIDGYDVRGFTLASLRQQIGMVLQDTFLFSATIGENIAYGRAEASAQEIEHAARLAQAHEFIAKLEKGYDTPIGERGIGLSGGQKQRTALARALLMDPAILILDEATSSVDSHTEHLIQEGLQEVMQGRTSIIIAKRLSTIQKADLVLVLENGRISEAGNPADLLRKGGVFRTLYDRQLHEPTAAALQTAAAREVKENV